MIYISDTVIWMFGGSGSIIGQQEEIFPFIGKFLLHSYPPNSATMIFPLKQRSSLDHFKLSYKEHSFVNAIHSENVSLNFQVTFESDLNGPRRIAGSSKQLHDEHVHEVIKEEIGNGDSGSGRGSSDDEDDEGGIVMRSSSGRPNEPQMQTLSGERTQ